MAAVSKKKTKGTADSTDAHVGNKLRVRRSLLGMSQEKLAEAVGLTFQQIQKYERGTNRVSAGRLYQFARILEVPISFFYDGLELPAPGNDSADPYSKENIEIVRLYQGVAKHRRKAVKCILKNMQEAA